MRISVFIAGALLISGTVAWAQEAPSTPVAEVGLNYSYARINPGGAIPGFNQNGGSGYIEYNLNRVVGLVADLGAYHNTAINKFDVDNTTFTYLFGPRFNWRRSRFTPYVQTLVGGARLNTLFDPSLTTAPVASTQNVFAAALGGGIDVNLTRHLVLKPAQLEYFMLQTPSGVQNLSYAQNNLRYSAGIAFRFGSK